MIKLEFKETQTTPQRLIIATQYLLAEYGYEAMSTRMIANTAGVVQSAISFHFENKENLAIKAMEDAAEYMMSSYLHSSEEIHEFLSHEPIDQEKAWEYIDRYLHNRIYSTLHSKRGNIIIGLAQNEHLLPENARGILSKTLTETNEKVLADLILAVSYHKDRLQSILISRSIFATIMTFIEKPLLIKNLCDDYNVDMDKDVVEDVLHDYFMKAIRAAVTLNV